MPRTSRQSGQALVAATFGLVALIAATGLAIDMGYLRYQRRLQQSAADSAALAGAAQSKFGPSGVVAAGKQDSKLNGYEDGVNGATVTVNPPPLTGPNAGKAGYVEVFVQATQPTFFMKIFGINSTTVKTRAVAQLTGGGTKGCLYTLGRGGSDGITTNGTAKIEAPNCGIIDNANMTQNGNSGEINAASIGVAGTASGKNLIPAAVQGIVPAADPLGYLNPPAVPACIGGNYNFSGNPKKGDPPIVLNPGNYCTGISLAGGKNVQFNSGTYVISGGGMSFNGNGTVTGSNVTFYFTATGGSVTIGGNQLVQFTAPTSGTYAGILFFQNSANATGATLNGANNSKFEGALYFPAASLTINGNAGSTSANMIVVVKSVTLNGATLTLPADFSGLPGGAPIKDAVLVE
jgi:Putative Flp pilus-assembly TadE/G-like